MNQGAAPTNRASDEAAIRAVESAYDLAWNEGDLPSILDLLTPDVVVVNPFGGTSVGREGMERLLAALFAGQGKGSSHTSEIFGVHFVTDDVALVDAEAVIKGFWTTAGTVMPPLRHRFTDVLVKEHARWLIAHVRAYVFMTRPDA